MIGSFSIIEIGKDELDGNNTDEVLRQKLKKMIDNLPKEFIQDIKAHLLSGKNELEYKVRIRADSLMGKVDPIIPGMVLNIDRDKSLLRIDLLKEELE